MAAGNSTAPANGVDSGRKTDIAPHQQCPGQRLSIGGSPSSQLHSLSSMNWVDQPVGACGHSRNRSSDITTASAAIKGLWHAHVGWLFQRNRVDAERWSPDLLPDKDIAFISSTAPVWMVASFVIPFILGWVVTQSLWGGLLALLWAGLVRIFVLHHLTWSINSICHAFGRQSFLTKDQSRNAPCSPWCRSGSHGTTHTALSRRWHDTGSTTGSSTRRRGSSPFLSV